MNANSIARSLNGRPSGDGWMAKCPAHDDRNPSLSIRNANGKVLLHCHAGCGQQEVIDSLKVNGLWQPKDGDQQRIVIAYDYNDESGNLLYQVVRYQPKNFKRRRPDGCGGWTWRKGERQVLYRLPEVLKALIVFVVEGERDVETLREYGFVATTNVGGAKAPWEEQYTEALRGREVILIPDNDEAGYERVKRIASALVGNVMRLVYLEVEGAKDVTEWFSRGHSELELISRLEEEAAHEA